MKLLEFLARRGAELRVEVGEGLIEQKHGGLTHDGARQRHPLPLATRELARLPAEQFPDA